MILCALIDGSGWRRLQCRLGRSVATLLAALAASLLVPQDEAKANVVCRVDNASMNMGSSNTGTGSIDYSCTSWSLFRRTDDICIALGNPSWPGTPQQPILRGPNNAQLAYNVFRDPSFSALWTQAQPLVQRVSFSGFASTVTGSFQFYAAVAPGQSVPAGNYQASFFNSLIGFLTRSGNCSDRIGLIGSGQQFTLQINHTVSNSCNVAALGDADLGAAPAGGGPALGSTTIAVRCPIGTSFNIGLRPSNGNSNGAGVLQGTGGNTDTLDYQLRQGSASGPAWGDTASSSSPGNGVSGTGNGTDQTFPVFVTVPDTNATPGSYRDTVIVTVHF